MCVQVRDLVSAHVSQHAGKALFAICSLPSCAPLHIADWQQTNTHIALLITLYATGGLEICMPTSSCSERLVYSELVVLQPSGHYCWWFRQFDCCC